MEWNWLAWTASVTAVVICGAVAWLEGNWVRRPGLSMGFANHGGMWGDLLLLPVANAVIVPHLTAGLWIPLALALTIIASVVVHVHWYRGDQAGSPARRHSAEHMWPARPCGSWRSDLSWAGWLHVLYVAGELTLLAGFLIHPMPLTAILIVASIFTVHVPIGLLQPRWFISGRFASFREQPLLVPCLTALWLVAVLKAGGFNGML